MNKLLFRIFNVLWAYLLASGIACFVYAGSLGEKTSYLYDSSDDKLAQIHMMQNLGVASLVVAGLFAALAAVVYYTPKEADGVACE